MNGKKIYSLSEKNRTALKIEILENMKFESNIFFKLQEAEREAEMSDKRYSFEEVLDAMHTAISKSV